VALEAADHPVAHIVPEALAPVVPVGLHESGHGPRGDEEQPEQEESAQRRQDRRAEAARGEKEREQRQKRFRSLGEESAAKTEGQGRAPLGPRALKKFSVPRQGEQFPAGIAGQGDEEDEQRIGRGDAALLQGLEAERVGQRGDQSGGRARQLESPRIKQARSPGRGEKRGQPRGERAFAAEEKAGRLRPVDQRGSSRSMSGRKAACGTASRRSAAKRKNPRRRIAPSVEKIRFKPAIKPWSKCSCRARPVCL
jgi:hypothetical protein